MDCLRLNPGNLRDEGQVKQVVQAAKERDIPIRIGVNFGSLPPVGGIGRTRGFSRHMDLVNKLPKVGEEQEGEYSVVDHMVATALWEITLLEDQDFDKIKISMKAFDVPTTVEAYRRLSEMVPYPLHLGITEAGTVQSGSIRTAVGLGLLLYEGIGDTIRVSLSGDSRDEVIAGYEILKSLNLRRKGAVLVACPSCGRADVDVIKLANEVDGLLRASDKEVKVAVMGCEVNGAGGGQGRRCGHSRRGRARRHLPQGREGPGSARGGDAVCIDGRGREDPGQLEVEEMIMVSPEERISRIEGVIEQINERQGRLEDLTTEIIRMFEKKADKTEMRFMFVVVITLMVAPFLRCAWSVGRHPDQNLGT